MALALLGTGAPASGDTVELLDGSRVSGDVIDLGGNSIAVGLRHGRRKILKRDIRSVRFDPNKTERPRLDADLLIPRSGPDLHGDVKVSDDGLSYIVEFENGNVISMPRKDVLRVVYKEDKDTQEVESPDAVFYTEEVAREVDEALEQIADPDPLIARRAESALKGLGIFAIERVKEELARRRAAAASGADASRPAVIEALERVERLHQIKRLTPTAVEEHEPDVYRILSSGTTGEKKSLVEWIMVSPYVEESAPLMRYLLLDADQDEAFRAHLVGFFQGLERNEDLIDLYRRSNGKMQFALAVAMGKNRVLVGVPTLIDALEFDDRDIRRTAIEQLRKITGETHGYGADDLPSSRRKAIERWRRWWLTHRETIYRQTQALLRGEEFDSPQRREARDLWTRALTRIEDEEFEDAEYLLEEAIEKDPVFLNAHLSLARLYSTHLERPKAALQMLQDLVSRPSPGVDERKLVSVYFHLGQLREERGENEAARIAYERCTSLDPSFFRAHIALADLRYSRATRDKELNAEERERALRQATLGYRAATRTIETHQDDLIFLYREDLPVESLEFFDIREHNARVREVKSRLRLDKARCLFGVARTTSLLGERDVPVQSLLEAIELIKDDSSSAAQSVLKDVRNYLGLHFERRGEYTAAFMQYRRVLRDIDASDPVAQNGVRRTESRVTTRTPNR